MLMRVFFHHYLFEFADGVGRLRVIISRKMLGKLIDILLEMVYSGKNISSHDYYNY